MCQLVKVRSDFSDLFYPHGIWSFLLQAAFILIVYVPFFAQYVFIHNMISTCVRRGSPWYDIKTGKRNRTASEEIQEANDRVSPVEPVTVTDPDVVMGEVDKGAGRESINTEV